MQLPHLISFHFFFIRLDFILIPNWEVKGATTDIDELINSLIIMWIKLEWCLVLTLIISRTSRSKLSTERLSYIQ